MVARKIRILVMNTPLDAVRIYGNLLSRPELEVIYHVSVKVLPEKVLKSIKPDAVLLSLEWLPYYRLLAIAAKRVNIPVIYVFDGVIEWDFIWRNNSFIGRQGTFIQPLIADYFCAIGAAQARYVSSIGLGDKVVVTGLARLDNPNLESVPFKSRKKKSILISTANTAYHNDAHKYYVKSALRDLKVFFENYRDIVTPVWRISAGLARELGVENNSDDSFMEALAQCDGLISFTSTCLLEGMLGGKPVCQVDYRSVPLLVSTAWEIRSRFDIERVIEEMLNPPAEKIALQNFYFADELEQGNASKRIFGLLEDVVGGRMSHSRMQKSSERAPILYSYVHSQVASFSVGDVSLLQYELDGCEKHLRQIDVQVLKTIKALESDRLYWIIARLNIFRRFRRLMFLLKKLVDENLVD